MTTAALTILVTAGASFLLGSIPWGYLLTRWTTGKDIRRIGSGNIGFTNVLRSAGKPAAILTLLLDGGKGWLAVFWAGRYGLNLSGAGPGLVEIGAFTGVVAGHIFSPWLRFRGGKGIAAGAGAVLALSPAVFLACLGVWSVVVAISRYVSLGSVSAAAAFPVLMAVFRQPREQVVFAALLALLIILRHRGNIGRLLRGNESRLGGKPPGSERER